jgi:hypothetical protein
MALVALMIGVAPGQFVLLIIASRVLQSLQHANVRLRWPGAFERLLVSPSFHRLHHAMGIGHEGPARGVNFAVLFPVWDVLFRTADWRPGFVPTGIHRSEPNRPGAFAEAQARPTKSQLIAQSMSDNAVTSGKVSAAEVAQFVFDAMDAQRFYIYSHPRSLANVQTRLEDIMTPRNPSDPFAARPEIGANLRAALREG